jgi:peptidoglycan/LPS O-acetylase OafA/YrhL
VDVSGRESRPYWHLNGGDAIRAIACMGILCFHVSTAALFLTGDLAGAGGSHTWMTAYGEAGRIALRTASTGFYLFFVLSGFLVAAPFVSAFVEGRPRPRLLPYFRNRALRLLPAAWLLFAFVLVRHGSRGSDWSELLAMFTFTDDHVDHPLATLVGQTWTLRVDLTFYVLVPVAATLGIRVLGRRLGPAGRRRAVWVGATAVAAISLVFAHVFAQTVATTRSPVTLMCLFMPGVALAALLAGRPRGRAPGHVRAIAAALASAGVVLLVSFPRDALSLPVKLVIVGGGAGMALGGLVLLERHCGHAWGWMESRPVRWVGRRTYGLYLWHLVLVAELAVLFRGAEGPGRTYALLLPLVIATSLVAAALSYRFVERPAMRLRHRGAGHAPPATEPAPNPEDAPPAARVPAPSPA